jgi:hypothetical protein
MKQRPWIWFIVANLLYFAGIATLVTVAVRHKMQEVPVTHGR